jgi:hypothetical protein
MTVTSPPTTVTDAEAPADVVAERIFSLALAGAEAFEQGAARTHTAASHCSTAPLITGRTQLAPLSPTGVRLLTGVISLSSTIPAWLASEAGTMP